MRRLLFMPLAAALVALVALSLAPASADGGRVPAESVIVRSHAGAPAAAAAVARAGGTVTMPLPIIDGVAAEVPADSVAALRADPRVAAVTPNAPVRFSATTSTNINTVKSVYAEEVGATRLWKEGIRGAGVRIALVDTGVSPLADFGSRIVPVPNPVDGSGTAACVNLSGEATCDDTYGHGTFVAGLIAGNGASSSGTYKGVAPEAEIVSVKLAGRDGSADVSKVLAGIQWVVSFAPQLNIEIMNLSLGTNSKAPYWVDPLNFAVERAWLSGITVVVAASNLGPQPGTISKPADDPLVVSVAAVDDRETPAIDDDRLPHFSGRGPTADGLAKPDVAAPGGRVVSLRSPGSFIEEKAPSAFPHTAYRRGSGTSMSAGIVSGAAALILQANPSWTPDRVKFALAKTARKVAVSDPMSVGAGLIQAYDAARLTTPGLANQDVVVLSDGTGSLEDSRGDVHVTRTCTLTQQMLGQTCTHITGDRTGQGGLWNQDDYTNTEWTGSSWYGSQWHENGFMWQGSSWYGSSWYGSSWYGSSWYGSEDATSYGMAVPGSSWYGAWE